MGRKEWAFLPVLVGVYGHHEVGVAAVLLWGKGKQSDSSPNVSFQICAIFKGGAELKRFDNPKAAPRLLENRAGIWHICWV